MSQWRTIESAPKDGTELWLFSAKDDPQQFAGKFIKNRHVAYWAYSDTLVNDITGGATPTHWMPLPGPPK